MYYATALVCATYARAFYSFFLQHSFLFSCITIFTYFFILFFYKMIIINLRYFSVKGFHSSFSLNAKYKSLKLCTYSARRISTCLVPKCILRRGCLGTNKRWLVFWWDQRCLTVPSFERVLKRLCLKRNCYSPCVTHSTFYVYGTARGNSSEVATYEVRQPCGSVSHCLCIPLISSHVDIE